MTGQVTTLHGVLMDVMRLGVLFAGDSGVGKSELALELLQRGHCLVADDAPEFRRTGPQNIEGYCPPELRDFLEVRGLGVLNVRTMFGDDALAERASLNLILCLKIMNTAELALIDRLRAMRDGVDVLGVHIPRITLPVAPGRNLAILAETAVRAHVLALAGYDAAIDFSERQLRLLTRG